MLSHPIFDVVMAAYALMGCGLARHLHRVGTRPWTWQQPVRAPKVAMHHQPLSSGSDYVGLV